MNKLIISFCILICNISFTSSNRYIKVFDDQFNDSSLGNWDREVEDENKTVNNEWEHYTKSSKNSYT